VPASGYAPDSCIKYYSSTLTTAPKSIITVLFKRLKILFNPWANVVSKSYDKELSVTSLKYILFPILAAQRGLLYNC
jgi:hypothetical protein